MNSGALSAAKVDVTAALQCLVARPSQAEVDIDASKSWGEVAAALRAAAPAARRLQVRLLGAELESAAALAVLLQRCYEVLSSAAAAEGLLLDDVEVVPVLEGAERPCRFLGTRYNHVVLGGTFDHLHVGHKVLLTVAATIAAKDLAIGVSGPPLLESKRSASALEPWEARAGSVLNLLARLRPELPVRVEELMDGFGPSLWPEMEALVVSEETEAGGKAVNTRRLESGVAETAVVVVPLVAAAGGGDKESSTTIRQRQEGLAALEQRWAALSKMLGVPLDVSAHWATVLHDLAGTPPVGGTIAAERRAPLERVRLDLQAVETTAAGLALCVSAAQTIAPKSISSHSLQREALLEVLLADLGLSASEGIGMAAREVLPHASRPRVLGLTFVEHDRAFADEARRIFEGLGASIVTTSNCNSVREDVETLISNGSGLVVVHGPEAHSWASTCDELWTLGSVSAAGAEASLPIGVNLASSIQRLAAERHLQWKATARF